MMQYYNIERPINHFSTLVLGNGFDLDLGMKTSYKAYLKSKQWHELRVKYNAPILVYLERQSEKEWFDIEDSLRSYAIAKHAPTKEDADIDKAAFFALCDSFAQYLREQLYSLSSDNIGDNNMSFAQYFVSILIDRFNRVYSFNYTPLSYYFQIFNRSIRLNYTHIHGSVGFDNQSIIFGFYAGTEIPEEYSFLYKSYNPYFKSNHMEEDLKKSNTIVFFGHSLNDNDFHYYESLFDEIILGNRRNLYLSFIDQTYEDEHKLLNRIKGRGYNIDQLKLRCDYHFIPTQGGINNHEELRELICRLSYL